ncbi:hypothetical protein LIER_13638 [Lithospermum erythrorhizon]|uniref:Gag-pol polyprotein n=1 Tax=Lithospermum erythrorhizon TaxID=34254 RepID=A0AAV3PWL6_LITER
MSNEKLQSKCYYTTLSDDESDKEEGSDNKVGDFVAVTARNSIEDTVSPTVIGHSIDNINDDEEDLTKEELMANYQMLFMKWSKLTQALTTDEKEHDIFVSKNQELMKQVEEQRVKIYSLEEKIQEIIKGIKMMNSSTNILDEILLQGKRSGDNTRIGFSGESSRKGMTSPTNPRKWVAAGTKHNHNSERKYNWRCYLYGKKIYGRG